MPRQPRIEYPGAIYHIMSRGDRGEDIFVDDVDRQDFLRTLAETCLKTGFQIHAYCLMRNHFHLVVETPNGNLVAGMRWLLSTYTIRLNARHKLSGHVFSGRYKALSIEGSGGYLRTACDYVHLNPVRAGLLEAQSRLLEYPWSSFSWYLAEKKHRPFWLRVDRLLGEHGIEKDSPKGREEFEGRIEQRREQEDDPRQWKAIRRGWCLGSAQFREQLLEQTEGTLGDTHSGEIRQESAAAKGQRIIREELQKRRWKGWELGKRRNNDPVKLLIAVRLRAETTMTLKEIAAALQMGSWKTLNRMLYEQRRERNK
jgi:REP element-mobilizing transposase RayT